MTVYELDKAIQTAQIVLERRKVKFTEAHMKIFKTIFDMTERCARNV